MSVIWRTVASTGAVPKEGIESMGRRLLLILGMMLLALSTASDVRGQSGEPKPPSDRARSRAGAPAAFPSDLTPPADRQGPDDEPPPLRKTARGRRTAKRNQAKNKRSPARFEASRTRR